MPKYERSYESMYLLETGYVQIAQILPQKG